MAIVRVELAKRPQEQRDAIIAGITRVLVENGAHTEGVQVILYELEMDVWGQGGLTYTERARKRQQAAQLEEKS
ncbi:phenylpyruvate tautomerase PptA (4-oxalocrotonate tautomerase family) [Deinobacterium chartae]|uniref:Phenylpyruvate tautomerase PptA (4-oxalocrotonate tautomerase family) n=1 Tax=Deinobacterium chartae TaxID=521158 RepID=A0A841HX50_9DEIO|nr:tautomerase family protein [Deinobacterium chartae]MBB6098101.1 phenylpyruvate tautomerase PptA (4-oxalocrotonate tautomerase family) [Deinobacterium chartae]